MMSSVEFHNEFDEGLSFVVHILALPGFHVDAGHLERLLNSARGVEQLVCSRPACVKPLCIALEKNYEFGVTAILDGISF